MSEELIIASAAFCIIAKLLKKKKKEAKRRWCISPLYHSRINYNVSNLLQDMLQDEGTGHFQNFVRMSSEDFQFLLNAIGPKILRNNTQFRDAISVTERLAITLRFLATGDSYTSLQYLFKVSKQSISNIVPEVCIAITEALKDYIKMPTTATQWECISQQFEQLWNFPNCIGAMDGRHIQLQCPMKTESDYYNYKSFFSIVLFAMVDAEYNLLFVDVGCQGRISDGGVYKHSQLYKLIESKQLGLPVNKALPGRAKPMPYVILGDEAFPLTENIMKPYSGIHGKGSPERIFNYRLSRGRRIVENVFGIVSAIFRCLRKPILLEPQKAQVIVLASAYLHNFLRASKSSRNIYSPNGIFDHEINGRYVSGAWRLATDEKTSFYPLTNLPRRSSENSKLIRKEFTDYFITNGRISWQDEYA